MYRETTQSLLLQLVV